MDIKRAIEKFIIEEVCPEQGIELDSIEDDYPLIENMVLESLGILKILSFLDEELEIDISDIEITFENFETLAAMEKAIYAQSDN